MSEGVGPPKATESPTSGEFSPSTAVRFLDQSEWEHVQAAADAAGFQSIEEFAREATLRLAAETVDEGGPLECPHDDCGGTFATRRQLRGHLGSSEHGLDVPEGDFWCGYCGMGPTTWRGINAHHGSSPHDGTPVRLDHEPDQAELLAPDDRPDHQNPELLEELYHRHDGSYTEMCRQHDFDVTASRVRHYLIEYGIHEVTPQGPADDGDGPLYRDTEWLEEQYEAADGNVSEMHRQIDLDVPYRTLHKNLKNLGIHDPTESPGRSKAREQRDDASASEEDAGAEPTDDESSAEADPEDEDLDAGAQDDVDEQPEIAGDQEPTEPDVDEAVRAVIDVDQPDDVEDFVDLATPGWLDEATFYTALEMSDDAVAFSEALGWGDPEDLELMVDLLGLLDEELGGGLDV